MANSAIDDSGIPIVQYRVVRPVAGLPAMTADTIHVHPHSPLGWVVRLDGEERANSTFEYTETVRAIITRAIERGALYPVRKESVWRELRRFFGAA